MSGGTQYYLWLNDAQTGPFTSLQLRSMWTTGAITAATLCWYEPLEEWEPLGTSIEELIAQDRLEAEKNQLRVARVSQRQIDDEKKEKPIKAGEMAGIIFASLMLAAICFIVGILYFVTGKPRRGGWLILFSILFTTMWYLLIVYLRNN